MEWMEDMIEFLHILANSHPPPKKAQVYKKKKWQSKKSHLTTLCIQTNPESRILSLKAVQSFRELHREDNRRLSFSICLITIKKTLRLQITHLSSRIFGNWWNSQGHHWLRDIHRCHGVSNWSISERISWWHRIIIWVDHKWKSEKNKQYMKEYNSPDPNIARKWLLVEKNYKSLQSLSISILASFFKHPRKTNFHKIYYIVILKNNTWKIKKDQDEQCIQIQIFQKQSWHLKWRSPNMKRSKEDYQCPSIIFVNHPNKTNFKKDKTVCLLMWSYKTYLKHNLHQTQQLFARHVPLECPIGLKAPQKKDIH